MDFLDLLELILDEVIKLPDIKFFEVEILEKFDHELKTWVIAIVLAALHFFFHYFQEKGGWKSLYFIE